MLYHKTIFLLLCLHFFLPTTLAAQQNLAWVIRTDKVDPTHYYGITSGNGMIGIVSSPSLFEVKDVVLNGAYGLYGRGRVSNFLKGFQLLNWSLSVDKEMLSNANTTGITQALNMRDGSFTVSFTKNDKAKISYTYYALRHLPYSVMMRVTITPLRDIYITAASIMKAPDALRSVENYYNEIDRPHTRIALLTSTALSPTGKLTFAASNAFAFDESQGQEPNIIHEMWDNNLHLMKFSKKLKAEQTYSFTIVGSILTSTHHDDPFNEAERLTVYAKLEGYKRLLQRHQNEWEDIWKTDIVIEGDFQTQQEVRSMMYHLFAFTRSGTSYTSSPMGLSGLGYNGHVFLDTELWMFPALLVLKPEFAKSMIEYRIERLPEARHNAFAHGYKGAMFPWESAASGNEETSVRALTGLFGHHITACVGIAAWNYYCVTQDLDWLSEKGYPLLKDIADFWVSRVERTVPNQYDINNVAAAGEWAENVDNNAFTNAAARAALEYASLAARLLGKKPNADWQHVYERIPILRFPDGTTKEHATYKGEPIKQADVNLLAYPLSEVTSIEAIRRDLNYYEKRLGHGPTMTHAIFSILYTKIGDTKKALSSFHNGYRPNLLPPFGVMAETAGGTNPYFAAGAGGMLQTMLFGFGGLKITSQGLIQYKTTLPKPWRKIILKHIGKEHNTYTIMP